MGASLLGKREEVEMMKGWCRWERETGWVGGAHRKGARGRWPDPRLSWCQNAASSKQGSQDTAWRARPLGAARASLHSPSLVPHSAPASLLSLTRPSRARQHSRLRHGLSPGRPWKRHPDGTTSGPTALSLVVHAGAGQRPPLIGWRPRGRVGT